jgi:peptidoglycan hydrolase-like protein with peptidoglycan-binding domain
MRLVGALALSLVATVPALPQPAKQAQPTPAKQAAPAAKPADPKAKQNTAKPAEPKAKPAEPKAKQGEQAKQKAAVPNPLADSYNAMPLNERISIQSDLIWSGDYNGTLNGEFGERAIAAVKAFQKRNGTKDTGILNPPERAALATAAKPKQDAVGWRMIDDSAAGVRLGLPGKLAPQTTPIVGGTRWSSSRGEVQVETFRVAQPGTTLAALFDQMKTQPTGRKADYSVMRPDFFVISGLQNLKKFYVRAHVRGEEVRGITILYDQAMDGIMEPVVIAMSSAFTAFPAGVALAPPPRRKVEYATGVVVSDAGHIVTDRETIEGCFAVTVQGIGGADRIAEDKTSGLALLRVYAPSLKPITLASTAPPGDVTLLGIADPQAQDGGNAVSAARARVNDARALEPAPALGFSGAAALDGQGRLVGMAALKPGAGPGPAPAAQATLTPLDALRSFLAAQKIAPAGAVSGIEAAKGSVVRVICVRK